MAGKVGVITGAASGIGEMTSRKFVAEGASVVIADIDLSAAEKLADELNGSSGKVALAVRCDVSKMDDIEAALAAAEKTFGGVDIMCNNAGMRSIKSVVDTSEEEFWKMLDINLVSVFRGIKLAVPYMKKRGGGSIVNTSSAYAHVGSAGFAAYHAAKGGVSSLTRGAAVSLLKDNIRVNAVVPGVIHTAGLDDAVHQRPNPEEVLQSIIEKQPTGRLGKPEEVANVIAFLASDEARFVMGSEYVVDGAYLVAAR